MGGSVTMGVQCLHNPVQDTSRFARRDCAWPSRINQFLNMFLGYYPNDIFQIHVLTLGGTNTDTATTIWDYTLMPRDMPYPDIVIHGYATNDMHVLSSIEAQKRGITLEDMILDVNQKFIRQILTPKVSTMSTVPSTSQCYNRPPLLIYYDDYIGNEQHKIIETKAFSKAAHILSSYYDFPLISFADAVKDIVYTDTNEDWLSPHGWPERQVHPGMGMHIVSTWMIAYSLLHLATTYCSLNLSKETVEVDEVVEKEIEDRNKDARYEQNKRSLLATTSMIPKEKDYVPTRQNGLPPLRKPEAKLSGEPKFYQLSSKTIDVPIVLPPELNDSLTLDDISEKWNNAIKQHNKNTQKILQQCNIKDNTDMPRPCTYSWVGNLERKFDKAKHLKDRMQQVLTSNNGWEAQDDNNKLGYVAIKANATFEIELKSINTMIRTLNFMHMKSYGEKWYRSKLRVDVSVIKKKKTSSLEQEGVVVEKNIEMTGFHDKNTSETYTSQLDLYHDDETNDVGDLKGIADEGDDLRVRFSLIGGSTFKMMGMAFCDH